MNRTKISMFVGVLIAFFALETLSDTIKLQWEGANPDRAAREYIEIPIKVANSSGTLKDMVADVVGGGIEDVAIPIPFSKNTLHEIVKFLELLSKDPDALPLFVKGIIPPPLRLIRERYENVISFFGMAEKFPDFLQFLQAAEWFDIQPIFSIIADNLFNTNNLLNIINTANIEYILKKSGSKIDLPEGLKWLLAQRLLKYSSSSLSESEVKLRERVLTFKKAMTLFGSSALEGTYRGVNSLNFSPDGKDLFAATDKLFIFELATGNIKQEITAAKKLGVFRKICLSPNGQFMVAQLGKSNILSYKLDKGKWVIIASKGKVDAPRGILSSECFSPDNESFVTADKNDIKIWDFAPQKLINAPLRESTIVKLAAFNPHSPTPTIASLLDDGTIKIWIFDNNWSNTATLNHKDAYTVEFSPDNKTQTFVSASRKATITGYEPPDFLYEGGPIYGAQREIKIWKLSNNGWTNTLTKTGYAPIGFSNAGKTLIVRSQKNSIEQLDMDNGSFTPILNAQFAVGAMSPDGKLLVFESGGKITVFAENMLRGFLDNISLEQYLLLSLISNQNKSLTISIEDQNNLLKLFDTLPSGLKNILLRGKFVILPLQSKP